MPFPRSPRRVSAHAIDRRQALRALGGFAGAAALAPWLPGCGDKAGGATATLRPEELDVETVVVVMMENRSFDHYLGALSLIEGRAVDGLTAGLANPRHDGSLVAPFAMDLRCVVDPPHSRRAGFAQLNAGANDGFVREYTDSAVGDGFEPERGDAAMGYHTRAQLPVSYALADQFAICDRWFCSVLGPTWPNRFYLHSAQSNGRTNNAFPEDLVNGFTWPTMWDRLNDAGIPWAAYWSDLSFLLLWGRLHPQVNATGGIEQFLDDARSGRLPAVCSVEPTYFGPGQNDDHPPADFARGQAFLSSIVRAVAAGPQWERSLIVVTYDEHGGFYDHVPPPKVEDERADLGLDQLGIRVPSFVISPWTRTGYVSSMLHEHASVPAFVGWLFGLEPLTVRDANANFLLDTFDVDRIRRRDPRPAPSLPVLELEPGSPAECIELGVGASEASGQVELAAFAERAGLRELDRRSANLERLANVERALVEMGGAVRRRR